MACIAGVVTLTSAPVLADASGTPVETSAEQQVPPGDEQMHAVPVPPPSGPYPAPMMIRSATSDRFAPRSPADSANEPDTNWQLGGARPAQTQSEADYPPPDAPMPPPAHNWQAPPMAPPAMYRPLDTDETAPSDQSAPKEAQNMQPDDQSVKNAPASQSEPSAGGSKPARSYPPRPGYGYGYPMPPGYGYPPPASYGYGYPPPPYGYPVQVPRGP